MRTAFIFLIITLALSSCSSKTGEQDQQNTEVKIASVADSQKTPAEKAQNTIASEPMIGERIDGPANIRDGVNGKILFTLNENVLVSCTPLANDWYSVGLLMEVDDGVLKAKKVKKGSKIIVDDQEVGEIKMDMTVPTWKDDKAAWAELIGYTHKDNIKPESILENALSEHIQSVNSRSVEQFQPFIEDFQLEKTDQFEGYDIYYNYENWIEDPSPMWRIGLVFQEGRLLAILHARPLNVASTIDHELDRAFDCLVYEDVERAGEIVDMFNKFVTSVD